MTAPAGPPDIAPALSPDQAAGFQQELLHGVARSFALTIPRLPPRFALATANAYLLCRIADTIEDDTALTPADKHAFARRFIAVVGEGALAGEFAGALALRLSRERPPAERRLVTDSPRVLAVTRSLPAAQQAVLARCVRVMAEGMVYYQTLAGPGGLAGLEDFDNYCYHVAGVVGEMLTELYCDLNGVDPGCAERLRSLAPSFGQGLQMVNVLKDLWEDYGRGVCWLPREVFDQAGFDLDRLGEAAADPAFARGVDRMLALAHGHLRNALEYTLLIAPEQAGYRRFCIQAVGLGLLTLRRIRRAGPCWTPAGVKVSKAELFGVLAASRVAAGRDEWLKKLFGRAAAGLPPPAAVQTHTDHERVAAWFANADRPAATAAPV